MKVLTGKVIGGKIDVGSDLEEGSTVAILALAAEPLVLGAEDEQELADALAEIRAGHFVDGKQLVAELKAHAEA